ncbi:hypothetical protein [Acinetobacter sp. ANC 5502]
MQELIIDQESYKIFKTSKLNNITKFLRNYSPNFNSKTIEDLLHDDSQKALHHNYGFSLHQAISLLDKNLLNKNTMNDLKIFIEKYKNIKKWTIYSDYAFYDDTKKNDVVSFVILPYIFNFEILSKILKNLSPKDLKKNKDVNQEFLNFLKYFPLLSFNIVLNKDRFLNQPLLKDKNFFTPFILKYKNYNKFLTITDYQGYKRRLITIKRLNILEQYINKGNSKLKILHDLFLIGQIAGYITHLFSKIHGNIELIGWFSDKDRFFEINQSNFGEQPFIIDIFSETNYILNQKNNITEYKIGFGTSKNLDFLDNMLRMPDLLAGAMADWDTKNNLVSHSKFIKIISNLFIIKGKHIFINMNFLANGTIESSIMEINPKK